MCINWANGDKVTYPTNIKQDRQETGIQKQDPSHIELELVLNQL